MFHTSPATMDMNLSAPRNPSSMASVVHAVDALYRRLDWLSPIGFLLLRLWVAWQFFKSGLTKIPIENAIFLFENEYHVPLLSPTVAAYLATASELGLSALLIVGLAGRFSAAGLFILNIVAVISYADASLNDHLPWGFILLLFVLAGAGKLSIDYLIARFLVHKTD
jgi:putative oxidoreductase